MPLFIGLFMILGSFSASFVHDFRAHSASDALKLAAVTLGFFALAVWNWLRMKRKVAEKKVWKGADHAWLFLTFGMYVIGFSVMWHLEGKY